jgi:hypothetical protein
MAMDDAALSRIRDAWRQATDANVLDLLRAPEDCPPEVVAIVREEAARRQLEAGSPLEENRGVVHAAGARLLAPAWAFLRAHPLLLAVIVEAGVSLGGLFIPWVVVGEWAPVVRCALIATLLAGLVLASWPLRRCRTVVGVTVVGWCGHAAVGIPNILRYFPHVPLRVLAVAMLYDFGLFAALPCGMLCAAVWLRGRYQPIYPPGQCAACGYDLRGLDRARCPECGTPFELGAREEAQEVADRPMAKQDGT